MVRLLTSRDIPSRLLPTVAPPARYLGTRFRPTTRYAMAGRRSGHARLVVKPAYRFVTARILQAIRAGTDWIELDVHPTKCGKMIVTHDIEFSHATNVADFPEFADRYVAHTP